MNNFAVVAIVLRGQVMQHENGCNPNHFKYRRCLR